MPVFRKKSDKSLTRSSRSRDKLTSGRAAAAAAPEVESRANEVFPHVPPPQYPQPEFFQQQHQISLVPLADVQGRQRQQLQPMAAPSPAHLAQLASMVPPPMPSPMPMSAAAMQHQHRHRHPSSAYGPAAPPPGYVAVGPTLVPVGDTPPRTSRVGASAGMPSMPTPVPAPAPAPAKARYDQYEQPYPEPYHSAGHEQQGADYMDAMAPSVEDDYRAAASGNTADRAEFENDDDDDEDFILPTVAVAADDVWRNDAEDFVGAADSLRVLHQAIVAAAEDEHDEDEDDDDDDADDEGVGDEGSNNFRSETRRRRRQEEQRDVYDPSDIFLCIQGAALRYHATWMTRVEERQMRTSRKKSNVGLSEPGDGSNVEREQEPEKERDEDNATTNTPDEGQAQSSDKYGLAEEKGGKDREDEGLELQESKSGDDMAETSSIKDNADSMGEEAAPASAGIEEEVDDCDRHSSDENLEEGEQAAWDVWEEAIGAAAALATTCVGPAWQSQIRRRRRWLANGRTDLSRSTSMMSDQQDDGMSVSTVGMGSVAGAAWQAQEQAHMAQLLGQNFRQSLGGTPELEEVTDLSMGSNPQAGGRFLAQGDGSASTPGVSSAGGRGSGDLVPWDHPNIPEVLPAAMLRFAASVSEMAVPLLRTPDSTVTVEGVQSPPKGTDTSKEDQRSENEDDDKNVESTSVADVVGRAVWEAQRWLVRRQRVGNAQRDLVLALCCEPSDDGGESLSQVTGRGTRGQHRSPGGSISSVVSTNRNGEGPQWTIVGAHNPVASMLATWIETAKAGWPTQRSSFDPSSVDLSGPKDLAWSRVTKTGAIDWWYVLQVTRASTDLVTAGWRPPPRGSAGEHCIEGLLDIARRGLVLSSRDFKSSRRSFDQDAREERLAAASSSAEALSTLANVGSRGFLPLPTVGVVARGLCSLLASIDPTMSNVSVSSLYPLPRAEQKDEDLALVMEKEAFLSQRESCVADIAELLWSLLAHGASTCPAIEALLRFIELHVLSTPTASLGLGGTNSPSSATLLSSAASATSASATGTSISVSTSAVASASTKSSGSRRGDKKSVLAAAGAIRACGAAFWGDPPQVKGVGSLRIFWNQLLLILARISSSIRCPRDFHDVGNVVVGRSDSRHSYSSAAKSGHLESSKSMGMAVDTQAIERGLKHQALCLCEQAQPSLVVILEVAVALRRIIDGEFIQQIDTLAPDEWEPFLDALQNLVQWLDARLIVDHPNKCKSITKGNKVLLRRIIAEVRAIFDQTEAFLTRGVIDGNFHCIVDDEYRKRLYTLMLRTACPLLQPTHATNVALSVVRSWTWGGYYLNRGDLWYKIASDVLGDAFGMFDEESFGFRGYVHAPSVRREALLAVSRRYGDMKDSQVDEQRTPSRGTSRRGSADERNYTPAALTTKVNEMQVERICPFFLPYLHEILLRSASSDLLKNTSRVIIEVPSSLKTFASQKEEAAAPSGIGAQVMDLESEKYDDTSDEDRALVDRTIADEFRLRKCAVRILGRLFRILTTDRRIRQGIIVILRDVARSFCTFQIADFPVPQDYSSLFLKGTAKMQMSKELFCLSLEAIRQLGDCLATPFSGRPLTHWVCGEIMDALSTIVQDIHNWPNTATRDLTTNLPIDGTSRKVLVLSALMPMARIRVSHDGRALMTKHSLLQRSVAANIISAIDERLASDVGGSDESEQQLAGDALPVFFDQYERDQGLRSEIAPFVFVRLQNSNIGEIGVDEGDTASEAEESRSGTTISLDNLLASVKKLLISDSDTATNTSPPDIQHRSPIIDLTTEEVEAAIKALSYNTLHELMLCGLPVQFTLPPPTFVEEAKARNSAMATFASYASYTDSLDEDGSPIGVQTICAEEIVAMFSNSNVVGAFDGCRGSLALLASAISADDIFGDVDLVPSNVGSDEESLWAGLCDQLIDKLHSFLDDQNALVSVDNRQDDPSVPLLSTIYDVFTLSRATPLVPPESVRLRTVLVCLRLCSKSQACEWISLQGKVLALQCAGSVIRIMKDKEAQIALNESMWDMHPGEVSGINGDCFESLIIDLLVRRYLASKHVDRCNSSGVDNENNDIATKKRHLTAEFTSHETLAKETVDIDNFPVEKDSRATAAWLCGDSLVMCRLGDSKSRHRGWIEVTVRSPTYRLRRLVRLPLCNSIAYPEFPSSLWSLTRSLNKSYRAPSSTPTGDALDMNDTAPIVGTDTKGTLKGLPTDDSKHYLTNTGTNDADGISKTTAVEKESSRYNSEALDRAQAVIRRFEATPSINDVGNSRLNQGESVPKTKEEKHCADATPGKLDVVAMRNEVKKMRSQMEDMIVTGRIQMAEDKRLGPKRSISADNLSPGDMTLLSKDKFTGDADTMTAHSWLESILGRSTKNIERVEDELRSLGFPETMIRCSTSENDGGRSQTAVTHRVFERWQRLQSGPKLARAVGLLDRTACSLQTHKIALLFDGPGSVHPKDSLSGGAAVNEDSILLRATHGSPQFIEFSRGLGSMVMTRHLKYFSGGLDTSAYLADGSFALAYVGDDDDCQGYDGSVTAKTMVLFHSIPLMPPGVNNRKRHCGNDVVHIIFAEKDNEAVDGFGRMRNNYDYEEDVDDRNADVSGEFGFIWIIVSPSANEGLTRVTVKAKVDLDAETLTAVSHLLGTTLFPKGIAARCVRQLAIRADIACRSTKLMQDRLGLVSNYEERLYQIKKLSRHALQR